MTLSVTTVEWEGLTFYGRAGMGGYTFRTLEGWEGLPDPRRDRVLRPNAHGAFDSRVYSDERVVRVAGRCPSGEQRDALFTDLTATFRFGASLRPLMVSHAGRVLMADARLTRFRPNADAWGSGVFAWAAEWVCPDPLRYGPWQAVTTTFPTRTGGLRFPLYSDGAGTNVGALDFGAPSTTGRLELSNPGTADSWPQFNVAGPVPDEGFEIVTVGSGRRVRFEGGVPEFSDLVIDSATGTAVIDGVADRGGLLTYRDWTPIPAGGSVEFAFIPLGSPSAAVLTASVRPAFW